MGNHHSNNRVSRAFDNFGHTIQKGWNRDIQHNVIDKSRQGWNRYVRPNVKKSFKTINEGWHKNITADNTMKYGVDIGLMNNPNVVIREGSRVGMATYIAATQGNKTDPIEIEKVMVGNDEAVDIINHNVKKAVTTMIPVVKTVVKQTPSAIKTATKYTENTIVPTVLNKAVKQPAKAITIAFTSTVPKIASQSAQAISNTATTTVKTISSVKSVIPPVVNKDLNVALTDLQPLANQGLNIAESEMKKVSPIILNMFGKQQPQQHPQYAINEDNQLGLPGRELVDVGGIIVIGAVAYYFLFSGKKK
jgi:hypothetical protein